MSEKNQSLVNGVSYTEYPMQEGLTIGDVIDFLEQFPDRKQQISWYLIANDTTPFVGLHPEDPGEEGYPAWPMIVTSFHPYDQVR